GLRVALLDGGQDAGDVGHRIYLLVGQWPTGSLALAETVDECTIEGTTHPRFFGTLAQGLREFSPSSAPFQRDLLVRNPKDMAWWPPQCWRGLASLSTIKSSSIVSTPAQAEPSRSRSSSRPSASDPGPGGFRARRSAGSSATFDNTSDGAPSGGEL